MMRFFCFISCCLFAISGYSQHPWGFTQNPRKKISLNTTWKFKLGNPNANYFEPKTDVTDWQTIHIPHTLKLTSLSLDGNTDDKTQATFHREVGWYRKKITAGAGQNRKTFIEFEGAHQVTTLWVNGQKVGVHDVGGYTPFHFDITDYIESGAENLIVLLVDNRKREDVPPDPGPFDYIKFGGLYRDVYLVETNRIRIPFKWEVFQSSVRYTTPSVDPINGNATINIETTVKNETTKSQFLTVVNRVIDHRGRVVLRLEDSSEIKANGEFRYNQIGGIEDDIRLWSIKDPYLYRLHTMVYHGNIAVDAVECKVGIRKFEHHPREGFLLNGRPIKLNGMNRHQHYPYVGDAISNAAHYKDIFQLKNMGFNVVRTAHYPQDDALLKACDELGVLVYEEPPTWISIGNDKWFANLEKASRSMVRNHTNHPSVVIWGAGINHRGYVPKLHFAIKQEDPSRLTASQNSRWTGWQTSGLTDIYGQMIYGPVDWDRQEPMLAMEGRDGIKDYPPYMLDPLLTGIIAWTAHDYYSFHPSPDQDRVRNVGIMSIFREPYTETHFYPIELKEEPQIFIASDWEETTDKIIIYSNSEEVEISINNQFIERYKADRSGVMSAMKHPPFEIDVPFFEPGTLTAIGINNNKPVSKTSVSTRLPADRIELFVDTMGRSFTADGSDLLIAYATVTDRNGMPIVDPTYQITFSIEGPGQIVGDGHSIGANPMHTTHSVAPVLIQSDTISGAITLKAEAENLENAECIFLSKNYFKNKDLANTDTFTDVRNFRVDLGGEKQLIQYDWIPWSGKDSRRSEFSISSFEVALESISVDGLLRWLGEMNVKGKYGYAFGEGILALDSVGCKLTFDQLPQGYYELTTFHHAPASNTDSMDPNKGNLSLVKVTDLPAAEFVEGILKNGTLAIQKHARITQGKSLSNAGPGKMLFKFQSNGTDPVEINFKSRGEGYVWLNALALKQLIP